MDEPALIQTAQHGELDSFNTLILHYQDMVFNVATTNCVVRNGVPPHRSNLKAKMARKLILRAGWLTPT